MYSATILIVFLAVAYAAPLSSCGSQIQCLDLDLTKQATTDSQGKVEWELCLFWRKDLPECRKDDTISHACPMDGGSKIEGWKEGRTEAMCNIVSCDQSTVFAIKDGKECLDGALVGDFGIVGYDKSVMCYDGNGGDCSDNNSKACRWLIEAPDCEATTTTTTTTTTTSTTTTTADPDVTVNPDVTVPEEPTTTTTTTEEPTTTTTTTTPVDTCSCNNNPSLPLDDCLSDGDCAFTDDVCDCHDCDCAVIDEMGWSGTLDALDQRLLDICEDCFLNCEWNGEGCGEVSSEQYASLITSSYERDSVTELNTNEMFVPAEDADLISITAMQLQRKNVARIVIIVTIAIVALIILVICGAWVGKQCKARKNRARFETEAEDAEDAVDENPQRPETVTISSQ